MWFTLISYPVILSGVSEVDISHIPLLVYELEIHFISVYLPEKCINLSEKNYDTNKYKK